MYLKHLELVGFKSFANKTRLDFEPGMTAIVGPNGCGKSNISDAIRWVLGEQSSKALRGGSMTDCIFNGTDDTKPMGLAEVSLTMADCEAALGTDYHEVTVTRRVFRSGEGQYFINRTPCRLKDIQRLFMDTGIGTDSYSVMEQGKIDRILSSRPEDRREVFEEASGITKFKADKKEAIRKLEHTEANLLRLDDIIREVKRQIISLQRQAGKAKRYQEIQTRLRALDLYCSRERLGDMDEHIRQLDTQLAGVNEQHEALHADIAQDEQGIAAARESLAGLDQQMEAVRQAVNEARAELERTRQTLKVNQERIAEQHSFSERDSRDASAMETRVEEHRANLTALDAKLVAARDARESADQALKTKAAAAADYEKTVDQARTALEALRTELFELDNRRAHQQTELAELENRERSAIVKREKLLAEQGELKRMVDAFTSRQEESAARQADLKAAAAAAAAAVDAARQALRASAEAQAAAVRRQVEAQNKSAAKRGQIDLLKQQQAEEDPFPGGARFLLRGAAGADLPADAVRGALADRIEAAPGYQLALEAALRSWLDAVIVKDPAAARQALALLQSRQAGAARLLAETCPAAAEPQSQCAVGAALLDHVTCADDLRPLMARVLGCTRVVAAVADLPEAVPAGWTVVSQDGAVWHAHGAAEIWAGGAQDANPLSRKHLIAAQQHEWDALEARAQQCQEEVNRLRETGQRCEQEVAAAQAVQAEKQQALAIHEGECRVIAQEARQARERCETVEWELQELASQAGSGERRRHEIIATLDAARDRQAEVRTLSQRQNDELAVMERQRSRLQNELTDCRIRDSECRQALAHLTATREPLVAQMTSLQQQIQERQKGLSSYAQRIAALEQANTEAAARVAPLEHNVTERQAEVDAGHQARETQARDLTAREGVLRQKRAALEQVRTRKSELEISVAEHRMRRQTLVERVTGDYKITIEQVAREPEPAWEAEARPDRETLDTLIAELRAKLESMGPVNLVAIEEYKELEERYAFLTQQQDDLVRAKNQLMEMIKKINRTTTELFSETFRKVNDNFQEMFKKLFGGGSAKLVLVDEEDVLETGIEIIARPPGKKLQSVSLLSGGERTLTAVALLFSLYQVKPSPFCLLDELDAALDESNIGRFVQSVKDFLASSQFIVITHNRQTISAADVLYGVTMEKHGVSKIVSVKFSDHESRAKSPPPEPAAMAAPVAQAVPEPAPV